LVFLVNGRYRTLIDRVLRIRLAPPSNQVSREVSFEYLNRQLVWHAFTEFLLFLLPLVGISRWRRWVSRAWKKAVTAMRVSDNNDGPSEKQGQLAFLPERTCAICYNEQNPAATSEADILGASSGGVIGSAQTDITNPYETIPCGCIYCFVCITERLEAEEGEGWVCLRCGEIVKQCKPWNGDVLEEAPRQSTSGKVVGFAVAHETLEPQPGEETAFDTERDEVDRSVQFEADDALHSSNTWSTGEREPWGEDNSNGEPGESK
jgi:peroxin-2